VQTPSPNTPSTKVICLQVLSAKEKIVKILSVIYEHYDAKKPLLLKTENQESTAYLDKLLWEHPKESFLPHSLNPSSDSLITISSSPVIDTRVYFIFNFTKEPLIEFPFLSKIYEIEDLTSPEKKQLFEKKYREYSNLGYHLVSL
jgi:DNA polymerase IIIc chi subunit